MAWIKYAVVPLNDPIDIRRGDTFTLEVSGLSDLTTASNIWFTVKDDKDDADTASAIQIDELVGLLYIVGTVGTAAHGSITVTDAAGGDLTVALDAEETAKLSTVGRFHYDIQMLCATGAVQTETRGRAHIIGDVTRATS